MVAASQIAARDNGPGGPGGDADGPRRGVCSPDLVELAYDDLPLSIGAGQTILQPYRRSPEHTPYDGIVVAAGGPTISTALREQLALGRRCENPVQ
jgi:protein-L-isoaspartate O-methyltransferase